MSINDAAMYETLKKHAGVLKDDSGKAIFRRSAWAQ